VRKEGKVKVGEGEEGREGGGEETVRGEPLGD
jgi:hypothetical protein